MQRMLLQFASNLSIYLSALHLSEPSLVTFPHKQRVDTHTFAHTQHMGCILYLYPQSQWGLGRGISLSLRLPLIWSPFELFKCVAWLFVFCVSLSVSLSLSLLLLLFLLLLKLLSFEMGMLTMHFVCQSVDDEAVPPLQLIVSLDSCVCVMQIDFSFL